MTISIPGLTHEGKRVCKLIRESAMLKVANFMRLPLHEIQYNHISGMSRVLTDQVTVMIEVEVDNVLRTAAKNPKHANLFYKVKETS